MKKHVLFCFWKESDNQPNVEEGIEIPAGIVVLLFGQGEYQSELGVHLTGGAKKRSGHAWLLVGWLLVGWLSD